MLARESIATCAVICMKKHRGLMFGPITSSSINIHTLAIKQYHHSTPRAQQEKMVV